LHSMLSLKSNDLFAFELGIKGDNVIILGT